MDLEDKEEFVMYIDCYNVILRAPEAEDLPLLQRMINDPAIERMTVGGCFPVSADRQKRWFDGYDQQKELRCMLQVKGGATLGMLMLTDIDWRNRTACNGTKILAKLEDRVPNDMYNARMGLLHYAFDELDLECIYGWILEYNLLSRKNALRSGMKEEGRLRSRIFKNGRRWDLISYSITKEEFHQKYEEYKKEMANHDK